MKKIIHTILLILLLTINCSFSVFAETSLGDVNFDGKVTAADARFALRISASLENATEVQLIAADINMDSKVTAADARRILRISASLDVLPEITTETEVTTSETTTSEKETTTDEIVTQPENTTTQPENTTNSSAAETEIINGITTNELPYTNNGLIITSFSVSNSSISNRIEVTVKNDTGYAIDDISNFEYKCYNNTGDVIDSGNLYLETLNNGESCTDYFYINKGAVKIIFGDATIYKGDISSINEMVEIDGIFTNALPYSNNGLIITAFSFSSSSISDKVEITVKNNTGYAIDDISNFAYKCYDSSGAIVDSGNAYLETLNNNEECTDYFYVDKGTTKIVFGDATVYKGDATSTNNLMTIDGIETNVLPYSNNGLTITAFSFNNSSISAKVEITVKNETGFAIDDISNFTYKCYDATGTVIDSGNAYLETLNDGESCVEYFYVDKGTTKLVFGDVNVYKGETTSSDDIISIDGIQTNALPYSNNGLTITAFSFNNSSISDKVEITVKNSTGYAIDDISYFSYKCYDATGAIIDSGNAYLETLNDGESCVEYFYVDKGTTKIIFSDATVYKGEISPTVQTITIDGIETNVLPYTNNGLTIKSFTFSSTSISDKVEITVENNVGYAIDDISNFAYKCYDTSGAVIDSGNAYLETTNNGESCIKYFYVNKGTVKIVFGEATIYKS